MYHFNNSCKTCSKNQVKRLYKKLVFYCIGIIIINTKWHTRANITLKRISECPFLTQNQVKELIKRIYTLEIKKKNLGLNKKWWDFFFLPGPRVTFPFLGILTKATVLLKVLNNWKVFHQTAQLLSGGIIKNKFI